MSADDDGDDGPVGTREVARRVFAAEYEQADFSYKEGEEERAPSYVVTPSGAKANRLFFVGVLTEVEDVNEDMLRARIVDPTGAFVVYAGQYQPDARTFFERASPPEFVAVSGKARTFQPEDSDRVFTSVRPESVNAVDADTRDRWAVDAARATLGRVAAMARALEAGGDEDPAAAGLDPSGGTALALTHYGTTPGYLAALRELALDVARVVAGDRDEVRPLDADPDDPTPADPASLAALADRLGGESGESDVPDADAPTTATADAPTAGGAGSTAAEAAEAGTDSTDAETGTGAGTGAETEAEAETEPVEPTTAGATTGDADVGTEPDDDLGDFEPGGFDADGNGDDVEVEGAPDEMYELDEEERREIESEYDTEFSTGTEVDAPGEADIETPDPGEGGIEAGTDADADAEAGPGADDPGEPTGSAPAEGPDETGAGVEATDSGDAGSDDGGDAESEAEAGAEFEADEDVALDEYVLDRMRDLDDGTGADRERLVAAVVDETGADPGEVEDAIQDALMGGQCYEPDEGTLKPI